MTTIAWDGRYIACDGLMTVDDEIAHSEYNKIFQIDDDIVVAACGEPRRFVRFFETVQEGIKLETVEDLYEGGEAFVFRRIPPDGLVVGYRQYFDGTTLPNEDITEKALGTGSSYAETAMRLGLCAEEAVLLACEFDVKSGGDVFVFDTEEWAFVEDEELDGDGDV